MKKHTCFGLLATAFIFVHPAFADQAHDLLNASGTKGGLIVHLGCGDGKLTAALGSAGDSFVVHGLDADEKNIEKARAHIRSKNLYGRVSAGRFEGEKLPYGDNMVNLMVVESGKWQVASDEIARVLTPRGIAWIAGSPDTRHSKLVTRSPAELQGWTKLFKKVPPEIDEWTHDLRDAGGNPVASDRVVGPPRRLQWRAGPLWARSHGWTPSVSAMVSTGGRLFYICDESLTCVDGTVPSKWFLVARDAFNGTLLWKCPVPHWGSHEFSGTPNTGSGITTGRFTMPTHLGKRLVAVDDTVFITLGATAPVTAIDAETGKVKQVYRDTADADEILCSGGRLIVSINPPAENRPPPVERGQTPPPAPGKQVCAVDVNTGRLLWKKGPYAGIRAAKGQDPFGRLELVAGDGQVFLLTTDTIESLAADSGKSLWRIDRPALPEGAVTRVGFAGMYEYLLTVMVYHDGVVLLVQPEPNTHHTYHTMPGTLYAFDARDGRQMWNHAYGGWGHCTPPDVFVIDDVVWSHVNAEAEFGSVWGAGFKARDSGRVNYRIQAIDLRTGKLLKEHPTRDIFNVGHHHRCYRNRTTERFLMSSRRGVEFVDLANGENQQHHWLRSGCLLGNLPCNGLLYVTPHPCGCYIEAKLTGFNALAPGVEGSRFTVHGSAGSRLRKGPAYGNLTSDRRPLTAEQEWPTYRHDARRSGSVESKIDAELSVAWQSNIGGKPSSLVVADNRVLVAGVDAHTVFALNAEDGKDLWSYTAGARVDSPPTLYKGLAIFGSADGCVYGLRASDGVLVWRFDAAPRKELVMSFDQLESPWPVPGSVLVLDGKCWFAAGRSSYLDGGIHLYALDPETGKVLHEETVYSPDPDTGIMSPEPSQNKVAGLLNDILTSDEKNAFIRQMNVSSPGSRSGGHLYTSGGFLDDSWFNRTFWKMGRAQTSGLMVLGDDVVYGMEVFASRSRESVFKPGSNPYRLRCLSLKNPAVPKNINQKKDKKRGRASGPAPIWEQRVPIRGTALVRAGEIIFLAGSPDVVDPKDPHGAWEGRKGGVLAAFAAKDGKKLAEYKTGSPPVWDGMAVANGKLYLSQMDGSVVCFEEERKVAAEF